MSGRKRTRPSNIRRESRSVSPADTVTWVYGVLAAPVSDAILKRLPRLPEGGAPRAIALGGALSVVVAHVPREPFEAGTLESRLQDIDWVSRYASAHHAVIARLGRRGTVLPLRIFTVFDSDDRAVRTIGRNRARLAALATRIGARAEWVLRVHRPTPRAARTTPRRTEADSGTAFLRERARAQRERVARARVIDAGVTALIDDLTTLADDAVERAVEPGTSALAEAAFLIGNRNLGRFKRALTKSSASLRREGCRIALTGPWPVYSFVEMPEASRG